MSEPPWDRLLVPGRPHVVLPRSGYWLSGELDRSFQSHARTRFTLYLLHKVPAVIFQRALEGHADQIEHAEIRYNAVTVVARTDYAGSVELARRLAMSIDEALAEWLR